MQVHLEELLDKYLIAIATSLESKIFYLKMKGDYFWWFAEIACNNDQKQMIDNFQGAYREAFDAAYTSSLSGALKFLCFSVRSLLTQNLSAHWLKWLLKRPLPNLIH
uniref:14-3-3 domain-containing protein n=2 Tax=Sus scrofa TaxID=9823 RepID=A0A4X1UWN7_PIG